jgi:hypothetical protein
MAYGMPMGATKFLIRRRGKGKCSISEKLKNHEDASLPSHKKAKNECLACIILISSGSVGLDFLKWFKNFNTCRLVIS